MKHFYLSMLGFALLGTAKLNAQTGPNLLGAKGTFSAPFVTPNTNASSCAISGSASYNPVDNIGNALNTLTGSGPAQPGSGYDYTAVSGGIEAEYTYTLIKNIGDKNGGNCIKGSRDWRAQDHTGDGGWFMAVNGAPDKSKSPIFYQIKSIAVCPGTTYEFSAWVINVLPKSSPAAGPGSEPNISFKVTANGVSTIIANSGPIAYHNTPKWIKVTGQYTVPALASSVDLEVINATAVASGNDLGLDDISFNVVQSNISVTGPNGSPLQSFICDGSGTDVQFTVNDISQTNTWYKWEISTDGGATFRDSTAPAQATFSGSSYALMLHFANVTTDMNGYKYRLVVASSEAGLTNPDCSFVNEYTIIITSCGIAPVTLTSFSGKYSNGLALLEWQTSQELNNDRFEIYRSTNGEQFTYVGSVKGAGNSNEVKNYSYTDQPGTSPYVYYRLRQVDIDGKAKFSNVVRIATGAKTTVEVYPNPFTSYFTLSFSASKSANATLVVRNSIGQVEMQRTIKAEKGNNTINITNLPPMARGIHYVSIFNDDINYNLKLQKQ